MNEKKKNEMRFMNAVKQSGNKKNYVPDRLLKMMNEKKYFTNEDIDLDDSCYAEWNSYEIKLIRRFLDDNAHKYSVGELLDEGLITDSAYTRRKLVYSGYSKEQLLNQKKAKDRENRIDKILA